MIKNKLGGENHLANVAPVAETEGKIIGLPV